MIFFIYFLEQISCSQLHKFLHHRLQLARSSAQLFDTMFEQVAELLMTSSMKCDLFRRGKRRRSPDRIGHCTHRSIFFVAVPQCFKFSERTCGQTALAQAVNSLIFHTAIKKRIKLRITESIQRCLRRVITTAQQLQARKLLDNVSNYLVHFISIKSEWSQIALGALLQIGTKRRITAF